MSNKTNKWLQKIHDRLIDDQVDLFTDEIIIWFNNKDHRVIVYHQKDKCCIAIFSGDTKKIAGSELEFFIGKNRTRILSLFKYFKSGRQR